MKAIGQITKAYAVLTLALLLSGCASGPLGSARLSKREAVQIAVASAQKDGEHLKDYKPPRVSFDSERKQWTVYFDHKPPGFPGGYIWFDVDDRTGTARRLPSD